MSLQFLDNTHLKMPWVRFHIEQKDGSFVYPPPPPLTPPLYKEPNLATSSPSPPPPSSGNRISPAVLFVIVILAVLFFISGLLHLLVRFLIKHPSAASRSNRYPEISTSDALQRQLQQLFHLNDSGLDQAFIDALPVFQYKEIVGAQEPFDCAVCLCEFSEKDRLRLLPMCSHAFHINCIDTWLQSNSTCPLCRGTLFNPGFSMENPIFDFDDIREDEECGTRNGENGGPKTMEIQEIVVEKGVLPVRLGKFKRLDGGPGMAGGETSSSNLDARRCFSMGSYQYVLGKSDLKVPLCSDRRPVCDLKPEAKESEQNGDSSVTEHMEGKKISNLAKGESFSVSKIWLWSKKDKFSSDAETGLPSSLSVDLPWMEEREKKSERPTFMRIYKKSVEEYKVDPYLAAVSNCGLWVFYQLPMVHPNTILMVTINATGLFFQLLYLSVFFFFFAPYNRREVKVGIWFLIEMILMGIVTTFTFLFFHTHKEKSSLVGILCVIFAILMYISPLTIMKKVIETRSMKNMPFSLSLAKFLNGVVWVIYALIKFDLSILIGNRLGALSGALQLIFYMVVTITRQVPEMLEKRRKIINSSL